MYFCTCMSAHLTGAASRRDAYVTRRLPRSGAGGRVRRVRPAQGAGHLPQALDEGGRPAVVLGARGRQQVAAGEEALYTTAKSAIEHAAKHDPTRDQWDAKLRKRTTSPRRSGPRFGLGRRGGGGGECCSFCRRVGRHLVLPWRCGQGRWDRRRGGRRGGRRRKLLSLGAARAGGAAARE